jgi:hypothetical protein
MAMERVEKKTRKNFEKMENFCLFTLHKFNLISFLKPLAMRSAENRQDENEISHAPPEKNFFPFLRGSIVVAFCAEFLLNFRFSSARWIELEGEEIYREIKDS